MTELGGWRLNAIVDKLATNMLGEWHERKRPVRDRVKMEKPQP